MIRRRQFVVGLGVASVVVCLVACGGTPRGSNPPATAGPPPSTVVARSQEYKNLPIDITEGSVRVQMDAALYEFAPGEKSVCVGIKLTNTDDARRLTYRPWGRSGATLTDNLGNKHTTRIWHDFAQLRNDTELFPQKPIQDALAWERCVPAAEFVILKISTSNFGSDQEWLFKLDLDKLPTAKTFPPPFARPPATRPPTTKSPFDPPD